MGNHTGVSMGGTIEYTRMKKKKKQSTGCNKCTYCSNGFCTKYGFRPTVDGLAKKCKEFLSKNGKRSNK